MTSETLPSLPPLAEEEKDDSTIGAVTVSSSVGGVTEETVEKAAKRSINVARTKKKTVTKGKKNSQYWQAEGRPKRPLSGYNLFFKWERERIIKNKDDKKIKQEDIANFHFDRTEGGPKRRHRKSHGKISFRELARNIADKWKALDPETKVMFEQRAAVYKIRYLHEREEWRKQVNEKKNSKKLGDPTSAPPTAAGDESAHPYGAPVNNGEAPLTVPTQQNFAGPFGVQSKMQTAPLLSYGLPIEMQDKLTLARLTQSMAEQTQQCNGLRQPQMGGLDPMTPITGISVSGNHNSGHIHSLSNQYYYPQIPSAGDYYDLADQAYNLAQEVALTHPTPHGSNFQEMAFVGPSPASIFQPLDSGMSNATGGLANDPYFVNQFLQRMLPQKHTNHQLNGAAVTTVHPTTGQDQQLYQQTFSGSLNPQAQVLPQTSKTLPATGQEPGIVQRLQRASQPPPPPPPQPQTHFTPLTAPTGGIAEEDNHVLAMDPHQDLSSPSFDQEDEVDAENPMRNIFEAYV